VQFAGNQPVHLSGQEMFLANLWKKASKTTKHS
jgi:hypothetical protein